MLTDRVQNLTRENKLLATEIGELRKSTESKLEGKVQSKHETPKSNTTKDPQEIETSEK